MKIAIKAILAASLLALSPHGAAAQSVDTGDSATGAGQGDHFRSTMDRVFGPGEWRQTSGYRTPAQEDALRRQGAGTVPAGHLSRHSTGSTAEPGAYDVVVGGMSSQSAAAKLRRSGQSFAKVVAERAHGPQGPHLHIEPGPARGAASPPKADADTIYLRIVGGQRNRALAPGSKN